MWHFAGESKPGFAKGTRSVYSAYTTSILSKIYRIDNELFEWLCSFKKPDVFLNTKFATYLRCHGPLLRFGRRVRAASDSETQSPSILVRSCKLRTSRDYLATSAGRWQGIGFKRDAWTGGGWEKRLYKS